MSFEPGNVARRASDSMVALIESSWLTKAVHVAVSLGIPDLLQHSPMRTEELAVATGAHAQALHRMMRALAAAGILAADEFERFSLTAVGATLRADAPGSLRNWALLMLGKVHQEAWGDVLHSVLTGQSAFEHRFGMDLWRYRTEHPDYAKLFDSAMASFTRTYIDDLLNSYSFSKFQRLIDVGGGDGSLITGILKRYPEAYGTVFDLPDVAERARHRINEAGLGSRCGVISGDAFKEVPRGGDGYILSRVLHDWGDDEARQILKNCRNALLGDARILVIERSMPGNVKEIASTGSALSAEIAMTDLNMLVMTRGRERTRNEYLTLFDEAGLELVNIVPTQTAIQVMEVQARGDGH